VWRSSPLSEEELSELPECVLCERLVRRAERGVNPDPSCEMRGLCVNDLCREEF
jgi:hypothetical protein